MIVEKLMQLIDKLPPEERMIIARSYYIKSDEELSPKVGKLKKLFDKLTPEEREEMITACGGRMLYNDDMDVAISVEEEVVE